MTNLSFTLVQRDRLTADTPAERAIRVARFAAAKTSEETSETRSADEHDAVLWPHAWKGMNIRHPLNYLWPICMGRNQ